MSDKFFISLSRNDFSSLYHGFVMANAAMALGKDVHMFFGSMSVQGLAKSFRQEDLPGEISSYEELRKVALDMGIKVIACETGLKMAGLEAKDLCEGCKVGGAVGFLTEAGEHPILGV